MAETKKYGWAVKIAVLLMFFIQMMQSLCNPSLAGIQMEFPGADPTTYQTIINIATLTECFAALVVGFVIRKIGFKVTMFIGCIFALIGGVGPAFFSTSISAIIGIRAVFGIGYGIVYAAAVAAVGEFWTGKEATQMSGLITLVAGIAGAVYGFIATGIVAAVGNENWRVIYQLHWLCLPIAIYVLAVMPQRNPQVDEEAKAAGHNANLDFKGLGKDYWILQIAVIITLGAVCVFMNNIAFVVMGNGIDPTLIGFIMTFFSVGLLIGGPVFIFTYTKLRRYAMPVYFAVDFVFFILMMVAPSVPTYCVFAAVIGCIFGCICSAWYDMIAKKPNTKAAASFGGALYVVIAGIAQFIGPFWMDFLGVKVFRQEAFIAGVGGNPFYQYYPAIVILGAGAILLFVYAVKNHGVPDYEKKDAPVAEEAAAE